MHLVKVVSFPGVNCCELQVDGVLLELVMEELCCRIMAEHCMMVESRLSMAANYWLIIYLRLSTGKKVLFRFKLA